MSRGLGDVYKRQHTHINILSIFTSALPPLTVSSYLSTLCLSSVLSMPVCLSFCLYTCLCLYICLFLCLPVCLPFSNVETFRQLERTCIFSFKLDCPLHICLFCLFLDLVPSFIYLPLFSFLAIFVHVCSLIFSMYTSFLLPSDLHFRFLSFHFFLF